MKKVLIDVGANLGQGLKAMFDNHNINDEWIVYSFEPNKFTFEKLVELFKDKSYINFINKGVWDSDCERRITYEFCPNEKGNIGGATNLLEDDFVKPDYIDSNFITYSDEYISCIDLSNFIKTNFSKDDLIILKLDCEGAEYPILNKMIQDNTLQYINEMYVEWHGALMQTKYDESYLITSIADVGIKLHNWN